MTDESKMPFDSPDFQSIEGSLSQLWESLTRGLPEPSANLVAQADSLTLVRFLSLIREQIGQVVPLEVALELPTLRNLASFIYLQNSWLGALDPQVRRLDPGSQRPLVARVRPEGDRPPLIFVPPIGGVFPSTAATEALRLFPHLDTDQPFVVLQPPALARSQEEIHPRRLVDLADLCTRELDDFVGVGPVSLATVCSGAFLAVAVGARLLDGGCAVDHLILIDPLVPPETPVGPTDEETAIQAVAFFAVRELGGAARGMAQEELEQLLRPLDWQARWGHVTGELVARGVVPVETHPEHLRDLFEGKFANERAVIAVCKAAKLPVYRGAATILYYPSGGLASLDSILSLYRRWLQGPVHTRLLEGEHTTLLRPPYLATLASTVREILASP